MKASSLCMASAEFRFTYHPDDGSNSLGAYDASVALHGIARSLSITTHYVLHGRIIKQAPALRGAKVLVLPPREGSFEFIAPIVDFVSPRSVEIALALTLGIAGNYLTDLTKLLYRRATGQSEQVETDRVEDLRREKPGEVDALADAIEEDVVRMHWPLDGPVQYFNIYGGHQNIGHFNQASYDYAKTKIVGEFVEDFEGNVASFNANSLNGRLWLLAEERTVSFNKDRDVVFSDQDRKLLAWSLNEYANGRAGRLIVSGIPLRSKQGSLKAVFVRRVRRAG
jgi:hypothetical protein